jgi:hypothetical protein
MRQTTMNNPVGDFMNMPDEGRHGACPVPTQLRRSVLSSMTSSSVSLLTICRVLPARAPLLLTTPQFQHTHTAQLFSIGPRCCCTSDSGVICGRVGVKW